MERTHKDPHANAEEPAERVHTHARTRTQAEAERREAIFHSYYERAGERSANTADLRSGSPLVAERVWLPVVCCRCVFAHQKLF